MCRVWNQGLLPFCSGFPKLGVGDPKSGAGASKAGGAVSPSDGSAPNGAAGAPKFGDKAAWGPRLAPGVDKVFEIAKKGLNAMPPKGGYTGSDEEFHSAVIYLTNAAK